MPAQDFEFLDASAGSVSATRIWIRVGKKRCMPLKNFSSATHSRLKTRKQQPASVIFSPETRLRTQLAIREEAMRTQLSPWLRAATREPQTQSNCFNASSKIGK